MKVEMTQPHIDAADLARQQLPAPFARDLMTICPICQALRGEGYRGVVVGGADADAKAVGHVWSMNKAALDFIAEWDQGRPVYPMTLELELEEVA